MSRDRMCIVRAHRRWSGAAALVFGAITLAVGDLRAQSASQTPAAATASSVRRFEVASVRLNTSNDRPRLRANAVPTTGRLTIVGMTIQAVTQEAYGLQSFELVGNGSPLLKQRIDIVAKADTPVTTAEMQQMLQPLLAERLMLVVHREMRDMDALLLLRVNDDRLGPKMKTSAGRCDGLGTTNTLARESESAQGTGDRCGILPADGPGRIIANGLDMRGLAALLAPSQGRAVVDQTRLAGRYDIDFTYTPEPFSAAALARRGAAAPPGVDPDGPTLATALRDQLGLRLEPRRTPVSVVVIDRLEPLTPD